MKMFRNYTMVMVTQLCKYTTNHQIVHFNGWILWNINYISIKLFEGRREGRKERKKESRPDRVNTELCSVLLHQCLFLQQNPPRTFKEGRPSPLIAKFPPQEVTSSLLVIYEADLTYIHLVHLPDPNCSPNLPRALSWAFSLWDPVRVWLWPPDYQSAPLLCGWERSSFLLKQVIIAFQTHPAACLCLWHSRALTGP